MSTRKILLVDDSKSARYALRLLLQKHNFEVDTAESAESALEKVKTQIPDAIFMDHLMPGMNGFEALEVLKGNGATAHIPVVMCTSNDDESYQRQAREKGALGILPKPATPDRLSAILNAIESAIVDAGIAPKEATVKREAPIQAEPKATPGFDAATAAGLIKSEIQDVLESQVRPLIDDTVHAALAGMKNEMSEALLARSAEQLAQWVEAEMARVRAELAPVVDVSSLSERLQQEIAQVKNDLVKMETDHAQAVMHKLRADVLPDLIQKQVDSVEQQVYGRLDLRLGELSDRLVEKLPQNAQLIRHFSDVAETAAEQRAGDIAVSCARETAERVAETKAAEVVDSLAHAARADTKRMYMLAGAAAAVGVLASLLAYFLAS